MTDLFSPFSVPIAYGSVGMPEDELRKATRALESRFDPRLTNNKEVDQSRFYSLHCDDSFCCVFNSLALALKKALYGPLGFAQPATRFYFGRSWPVIRDRDGGRMHFHSGAIYSGVFYLSVPSGAGGIEFLKPYRFLADSLFKSICSSTQDSVFSVTVDSNHFVLFNSELLHRGQSGSVEQNDNLVGVAFDLYTSTDPRNVTGGLPHFEFIREL